MVPLLKKAGADFSAKNMGICDSKIDVSNCLAQHIDDYQIACSGVCISEALTEL